MDHHCSRFYSLPGFHDLLTTSPRVLLEHVIERPQVCSGELEKKGRGDVTAGEHVAGRKNSHQRRGSQTNNRQ